MTERWATPVRHTAGQVTRDPDGVLHLEVRIGDSWWSAPAPATAALEEAIAGAQEPEHQHAWVPTFGEVEMCVVCRERRTLPCAHCQTDGVGHRDDCPRFPVHEKVCNGRESCEIQCCMDES